MSVKQGLARKRLFQKPQKRYGIDQLIPMLRQADVPLGVHDEAERRRWFLYSRS